MRHFLILTCLSLGLFVGCEDQTMENGVIDDQQELQETQQQAEESLEDAANEVEGAAQELQEAGRELQQELNEQTQTEANPTIEPADVGAGAGPAGQSAETGVIEDEDVQEIEP